MYVISVGMFMIRPWGMPIVASNLAPPLKTYPTIGCARCVEQARMISLRRHEKRSSPEKYA